MMIIDEEDNDYIIIMINYYTSTKSWRGYIFIAVSVCVCVSGILVNKIPAERMHRFGRGFR